MKWQYKVRRVVLTTSIVNIETGLNQIGNEGWELVSIHIEGSDWVFYLKRLISR